MANIGYLTLCVFLMLGNTKCLTRLSVTNSGWPRTVQFTNVSLSRGVIIPHKHVVLELCFHFIHEWLNLQSEQNMHSLCSSV